MNDHGFVVCAYNRTVAKVDHFLANEAKGHLVFFYSQYRFASCRRQIGSGSQVS